MMDAVKKEAIIKEFQKHPQDCGSADVQIAILSSRISNLTEHLKKHKKDFIQEEGF